MRVLNENDVAQLVSRDAWMMKVLRAADERGLPDWWIGAGFLRDRVWDAIEGNQVSKPRDVDLVFFDSRNVKATNDWAITDEMNICYPLATWEVRNQARMHTKDGSKPFRCTAEGIAHWTETATAIAVRLHDGELNFLYCYGSNDLLHLIVRPVTVDGSVSSSALVQRRIADKQWLVRWPHLQIKLCGL